MKLNVQKKFSMKNIFLQGISRVFFDIISIVDFREAYKSEYETKLAVELDQLRSKTTMEIEKLRESIKEMYERENRSFQHARDEAINERDRHVQLEREVQRKYDELLSEYVHFKCLDRL